MIKTGVAFALILAPLIACGQTEKGAAADQTLGRALRSSMLTFDGKPFHAVLEIAPGTPRDNEPLGVGYTGRVEAWWAAPDKYRVRVTSPNFQQEKTVSGVEVEEKDSGDYFPQWLETFVRVLTDPVPVALFKSNTGAYMDGGETTSGFAMQRCVHRDDRPGGITDQLTWGNVCFDAEGKRIEYILTFTYYMNMKDWRGFDGKEVARNYETDAEDRKPLTGKLIVLEPLSADERAKIVVTKATPPAERIVTAFVSTLKEESMMMSAPKIVWPPVREGKADGYMIVYARTDRTGQVRETQKHNSDNPGLENFGAEQALKYKFKPLIVDGVPQQMEMPLVLHFTSQVDDPLPVLSVDDMRKQTISCKLERLPAGALKSGEHAIARVSVDEKGKVDGVQMRGGMSPAMFRNMEAIRDCRFGPLLKNGKATYYKGDIEFPQ